MKGLCALMSITFVSQQDDTKIINFDSMAVFLKQCHFQICHFCLKSRNIIDVPTIVHCLASPGNVSGLPLKKGRQHE